MKLNRIEVLSEDEIQTIHDATMDLMSSTGVRIESEKARALLKENGAEIEESSHFVKFSESLIDEFIKKAPECFSVYGPDGNFKIDISTNSTVFATVGSPTKIYNEKDPDHSRDALMDDTIKHFKLVDQLRYINSSHLDVWPTDVPYISLHCHVLREWARNSRKPFGNGCRGELMCQDMMNLISIIVGSDKELIEKPRIIAFFNPISPLLLPEILLDGLFVFAKYLQPVIVAPAAIGGLTAPITIGGLLTQTNAEVLATIVLAEMINPGVPVFYGAVNSPMDPLTGIPAWGAIEMGLMTTGAAQLARFYNIPSRASGSMTNSIQFDLQCGAERMASLLNTTYAGINYITCAGLYEYGLTESLELLVIDDELAGIVSRAQEGVNINENTIALNEIKSVVDEGIGFMRIKHTSKNIRKELFVPELAKRLSRSTWLKEGKPDLISRSRIKIQALLEKHEGPYTAPNIEEQLESYLKEVETRNIDEYKISH